MIRPRCVLLLAAALWLVIAASASGQAVPEESASPAASPPLPATHWAVRAAARAEALGLTREYLPAQRSVPRAAVERALRAAAQRAAAISNPAVARMAEGWYARFVEEFPDGSNDVPGPRLLRAWVAAGYQSRRVDVPAAAPVAGQTQLPNASDFAGLAVAAEIGARVGPHLTLTARPVWDQQSARLDAVDLVLGRGAFGLSLGRGSVGYGVARSSGVVLSGGARIDHVELQTVRPVRLPSLLGALGPLAMHGFFGRFASKNDHAENPYILGARAALLPHPRLALSAQAAALFGGEHSPLPVNLSTIGRVLSGSVRGDANFENRIASLGLRYRLPTERAVPLVLYTDWGTEDAAGGLDEAPGVIAGLNIPALPGFPQAEVGVERAWFGVRCCRVLRWYNYGRLYWGATERPLGHPLGGNGSEWAINVAADLRNARLRIAGEAFERDRSAETLYGPARAGRSRGGSAALRWRGSPRAEFELRAAGEQGEQWFERLIEVGVRALL